MRREGIDDEAFAAKVGDCTSHAVRKWKYGERQPPGDRVVRIETVTNGEVAFKDFFPSPPTAAELGEESRSEKAAS